MIKEQKLKHDSGKSLYMHNCTFYCTFHHVLGIKIYYHHIPQATWIQQLLPATSQRGREFIQLWKDVFSLQALVLDIEDICPLFCWCGYSGSCLFSQLLCNCIKNMQPFVCNCTVREKKETFNPKISYCHNSQHCDVVRIKESPSSCSYSIEIFNTGTFYISVKFIEFIEGILC